VADRESVADGTFLQRRTAIGRVIRQYLGSGWARLSG
jgi:hypothetical protein